MNENIESNVSILQGPDNRYLLFASNNELEPDALPGGDDEPDVIDDSTGSEWNSLVGTDNLSDSGDSVSSAVGNGDNAAYSEVLAEIRECQEQQLTTLTGINSMLILIFAFLIMEWTEKKINVMMKRFVNRRR